MNKKKQGIKGPIKFLPDNKIQHAELTSLLTMANKIRCAVAFWGKGALNVFKKVKGKDIKIICNLQSCGTNPNEIDNLKEKLGLKNRIKQNSDLHAKVYWTENGVIIGSSNMSCNGLRLFKNRLGSDEANCLITDPTIIGQIERWFEDHWKKANKITTEDIQEAKRLWELRKKIGKWEVNGGHIYNRLKNKNITDKDAIILFFSYSADISDKDIDNYIKEKEVKMPSNYGWYQESEKNFSKERLSKMKKDIQKWQKYPINICVPYCPRKVKEKTPFKLKDEITTSKLIKGDFSVKVKGVEYLISLVQPEENSELVGNDVLNKKFVKLLNSAVQKNYNAWKVFFDKVYETGGYCKISELYKLIQGVDLV